VSCLNDIRYVLCLTRGYDKTFKMRLKDSNGDPIDLTNSTVLLDCKYDTHDRDATITDAVNGEFEFVFTAEETALFPKGTVHGTVVEQASGGDIPRLRVSVKTEGL
jgi:hypothetical protein